MNKRMLFMLYFHNNIDKMKKRFFRYTILLAFIFGLLSSGHTSAQSSRNGYSTISLPKGSVEGRLSNGLRYIIQPNALPRHSVEVRMIMSVGSLQEENDQRGCAHFLEHCAFIGTRHFPKRALVDYFEGQGMKFGRDINAFTGFDRTIYCLSLPYYSDNKEILDTTFLVLRDWLCGIDFDNERVKKERSVIVEELRGYQQNDDFYSLKMGHNRYAERLPLATEQEINSIDSNHLKTFYKRWYVPSHATVLIVGPVNVTEVVEKLSQTLGIIPSGDVEKPLTKFPMYYTGGASWMEIADSVQYEDKLELIIPHNTCVRQTLQDAVEKQRRCMLVHCLSERFAADSIGCNVSDDWYLADKDHFVLSFRGASTADLEHQLSAVSSECHRLLRFGVQHDELQQLIGARLDNLLSDTTQRLSENICDDFVDYITAGDRILWNPDEVEWVRQQVVNTTSAQFQQLMKRLLDQLSRNRLYAYTDVNGSLGANRLTAEKADSAWNIGDKHSCTPYVFSRKEKLNEPHVIIPLCLTQSAVFMPDSIENYHKWTDIGAEEIVLKNGLRIILRPTIDEDSTISLVAIGRGGTADLSLPMQLKLHDAVSYVDMGGLYKIQNDTLLSVMTQEKISMTVGIDNFWHQLMASAPANKSTELFNLVYQKMCFPGINRKEFKETVTAEIANLGKETILDKMLAHDVDRLMAGTIDSLVGNSLDNSRRYLTVSVLDSLDIDTLTTYYKNLFADPSRLTIILTGNFSMEDVLQKAVATFSQIAVQPLQLPLDNAPFRIGKEVVKKGFGGGNDRQTLVNYIFAGNYTPSLQNSLCMKLIRDVLQDRVLKVLRERENLVYSPYVDLYYDGIPQQKYHFLITVSMKDDNQQWVERLLKDIIKQLKASPISTSELGKMKRSFLVTKDKNLHDKAPSEWKTALMTLVKNGESLYDFDHYAECLNDITPKKLQKMINEMIVWDKRYVVYKTQMK